MRREKSKVTIKDVARVAGVSATTISNFLNDRVDTMTEETRLRIQETIQALQYRPNLVARGLITRRTITIGLILAEVETPLFLQAVPRMEQRARDAGYSLLLCVARSVDEECQAVNLLLEKQVDGLIFMSTSKYRDDSHILKLQDAGLPVILVNRANRYPGFTQVNWDQTSGIAAMVKHLADQGHRSIAHLLGPSDRRSTDERLSGYRLGLQACGLEYRPEYVLSADYDAPRENWRAAAQTLLGLPQRPTAIIASDDMVALETIKTIQQAGLSVPRDLAVLGIDDQPWGAFVTPTLTSLHLPVVEAGNLAMQRVLDSLGGRHSDPEHILLPCTLMERESSSNLVADTEPPG